MPRDSQGNTNPLPGTIVQTGDTILPSQHNPALTDLYAMMSQSLSRDGQGGMRANLAMNNFQVTGLGSATQPGNAVPLSQFQSGTPVGAVVDFAGVTPPDTWMFCFGQPISVAAYPKFVDACYVGNALNATAGFGYRTTSQTSPYNNRSTSGQFIVLPDLRGLVSAGKDDMGGNNAGRLSQVMNSTLIGNIGGNQIHILTIPEMPPHDHGSLTGMSGAHAHTPLGGGTFTINAPPSGATQNLGNGPNPSNATPFTTTAPDHVHLIPIQGAGNSHNNTQPTLIMNKIIKVSY